MTITPIAFTNSGVDVATDADLLLLHPELSKSRWSSKENFRDTLQAAYNQVAFDISRIEDFSDATLIDSSAANIAWYKMAVTYQALIRIFRDFRAETGDRWDLLLKDYQRLYDQMIENPSLDYDVDESGTVDDEESPTVSKVELTR